MAVKFNDNVWVWGHPTGSMFKARGGSEVTPVQGVAYMNASGLMYNNFGEEKFDLDIDNELSKDVKKVGWCIEEGSATHPEMITAICEKAKKYPNIKMGMFDDFFSLTNPTNNFTQYPIELMVKIKEELHAQGLEMWVVIYTENFRLVPIETIRPYLKLFDGVSLWFWSESEIFEKYDECVDMFMKETEGQKRMLGLYVYNFGERKEATIEAIKTQLENAKAKVQSGEFEGLFLHPTPAFDLKEPFEAEKFCKEWMAQHGDDIIG